MVERTKEQNGFGEGRHKLGTEIKIHIEHNGRYSSSVRLYVGGHRNESVLQISINTDDNDLSFGGNIGEANFIPRKYGYYGSGSISMPLSDLKQEFPIFHKDFVQKLQKRFEIEQKDTPDHNPQEVLPPQRS